MSRRASESLPQLIRRERDAGREVVVVPAGSDKHQTMTLFAEVLDFPVYFGRNLDALADSLRAHAARRTRVWTLIWAGGDSLRSADPRTYAAVVEILKEVAEGAPSLDVVVHSGRDERPLGAAL